MTRDALPMNKNLLRDARGFAAVEFGLALPVLGLMLLGFIELDRYAWAGRQLENTAHSIAQMLSQTTRVEPVDLKAARDSVMVLFPRVLQDSARQGHKWSDDISVSMTTVGFTPTAPGCVASCTYQAKVGWSGGTSRRPCNTPLTPAPNNATPSPTTLPTDAFGPNSIIVVDLAYTYKPLFAEKIFGGVTIRRSSYLQPRYVSTLSYAVAGGDTLVTTCS
ncbi:pilus assembly protein [Methylocystis sp. WRRC1]|uniref:TadE/TadG family type IV pilus assembly protein n=1 Tax=Methylocystis sp. WRRC1 TaxID=1732014 RepID=UPI001D1343B3|nr:TadE/TadG family type IV pilus assembly protein [Methylocystis sp. WRRC1]MCC3247235.1 pilus assembly protein [Methylocystis sp. WRRC1]